MRICWSPDFGRNSFAERWQDRLMPGHITVGPVTLYGANAMHWTLEVSTRWGHLCIHPTTRTFGGHWPWHIYMSRDGTPGGRSWGFGPGIRWKPKRDPEEWAGLDA